MNSIARPSDSLSSRDGWLALGYFAAYLAYLFWRQESEWAHWVTLVLLPFVVAVATVGSGERRVATALATLGIRWGNLRTGVGWALLAGALITAFQATMGGHAAQIQELIATGRALWMFPLTFVLMMVLAGFTEEFFFRGFLQTRLEALFRSRWLAVLAVALLFGVYHVPYAYFNPQWPSAGDWGAAWSAALGNGVPGGLILGTLYALNRGNLAACVVLHSLINAAPAMTMIRFGGG
ncbi:MAG: CPBP family intramembrane metalloprotease [Gemmatimonadota bacterium]|nr:CPBP family intramembrane metalloprotease [Gemmatimonadota bacterium]